MKSFRKQLITLVALYMIGTLFLIFTNPQDLPLPLLILPFVYAFIVLFLTIRTGVSFFSGNKSLGTSISLVVTIFVVMSLILASIRQLSARDLLISFAITVLLGWYLVKIKKV